MVGRCWSVRLVLWLCGLNGVDMAAYYNREICNHLGPDVEPARHATSANHETGSTLDVRSHWKVVYHVTAVLKFTQFAEPPTTRTQIRRQPGVLMESEDVPTSAVLSPQEQVPRRHHQNLFF